MVAVLDHVGCERVALLSLGVPIGLLFAATHPERTTAVALVNGSVRFRRAVDYPQGFADGDLEPLLGTERDVGGSYNLSDYAPSLIGDERFRRWFERAVRLCAPPEERMWRARSTLDLDLRDVIGAIRAPTLVVNRRDRRAADQTRYIADHIAGTKYVEVAGEDLLPFVGDTGPVLDAIEEFLSGHRAPPEVDRVLATVLFTDLVDSTPQAAALGDRRWRELLITHDALVVEEVDRFRGQIVKFTGDGVLATFDGPGRAIRCACAIRDAVQALGVEVRAGLHTGEIERRGDDVSGIAVHTAQRVSSLAGAGEVLVSRTVADLLAGSDFDFREHGEHELKGLPGSWRIFSVQA
jgi:class 3 adenylate cyclase